MAQQTIGVGASANDGTGDQARTAFTKVNANFTEVYATAGAAAAKSANLSDLANAATAFSNIKQAASTTATGVVELATTGEATTGTDTVRAVTPAGVKAATDALIVHGTWTPVVKQGATTLTGTASTAKYTKIGKKVFCELQFSITSAGSAGTAINIGNLPFAPSEGSYFVGGSFMYFDSGTNFYIGAAIWNTADSTVRGAVHLQADVIGVLPSFTAASGDFVTFSFQFETV